MRSSFERNERNAATISSLVAAIVATVTACGHDLPVDEHGIRTGPPAPLSVLSADVVCANCPDAAALRPPWLQTLVARRDPDVVLVQGLTTREDMEAIAAVLPDYESFYIGRDENAPLEYFGAVIWLRRNGFALGESTGATFLTPDGTPDTRFPEAQELHAIVGAWFRDCRSDLAYSWHAVMFERNAAVQEESLDVIGRRLWISVLYPVVLAGAFGIAPTDPLYPKLLSPPDATEEPANTQDLADFRDTSAVPNVNLQSLTDHVMITTRRTHWMVPRWTLESTEHEGKHVVDHPPMSMIVQEREASEVISARESCRNTAGAP